MGHTRWTLIAYVCEGGVVYASNLEGAVELRYIVAGNVHGCRYAVVLQPTAHVGGPGLVQALDLDTVDFSPSLQIVSVSAKTYPNLDAAIAACVLTQ